MTRYEKILRLEAKTVTDKLALCKMLNGKGIEVNSIRVTRRKQDRYFNLNRLKSTPEALENILTNFKPNKGLLFNSRDTKIPNIHISINTSDVIGTYISISTVFGIFSLLTSAELSSFYKALGVKDGVFVSHGNYHIPAGDWGVIRYQGGEIKFYPRKNYSKKRMMEFLSPLLYTPKTKKNDS